MLYRKYVLEKTYLEIVNLVGKLRKPPARFELATSRLQGERSTTELRGLGF